MNRPLRLSSGRFPAVNGSQWPA